MTAVAGGMATAVHAAPAPNDNACIRAWNASSDTRWRADLARSGARSVVVLGGWSTTDTYDGKRTTSSGGPACLVTVRPPGTKGYIVVGAWSEGRVVRWSPQPLVRSFPARANVVVRPDGRLAKIYRR